MFFSITILCWFSCCRDHQRLTAVQPPVENGPDTTSHNFIWEIDTLGTRNSYLMDVAVIDENNIWAVGELYTDETTPYNAVYWNGQKWNFKRLFSDKVISPVRGIWAISNDNIWLAAGSIYQWNGIKANLSYLRNINTNELVQRLWYNDEKDIYGVGTEGLIVHYDGQSWQRLDSGTNLLIGDIWGAKNPITGKEEILCIASDQFHNNGMKLLKIENNIVSVLPDSGLPWSLSSIWFIPGKHYYLVGDGVFETQDIYKPWKNLSEQPLDYRSSVRGTAVNDVFISGSHGLLSHYNGSSWFHYTNNILPAFYGTYGELDLDSRLLVAVGWINDQGIILRGFRK